MAGPLPLSVRGDGWAGLASQGGLAFAPEPPRDAAQAYCAGTARCFSGQRRGEADGPEGRGEAAGRRDVRGSARG